jgi:NhaP-type Na+/H+ or K+/H+ antiporter
MEHQLTLMMVLIGVVGIGAQWLAWRLNLPAILLLLLAGLIAGPGLGWVNPSTEFGDLLEPLIGLFVYSWLSSYSRAD